MSTFYQKDQLKKVARLIKPDVPMWLLLGGPADGNEAQCAVACWPGVRVLAVEPNAAAVNFQRANGFPGPEGTHWLLDGALADCCGRCEVTGASSEDLRHARTVPEQESKNAFPRMVECWKLDDLDVTFGPFREALLWLDVEGAEARALAGAENLLRCGAVWWVTVETSDREPEQQNGVGRTLRGHGFEVVSDWGTSGRVGAKYRDTLWRLKDAKRS